MAKRIAIIAAVIALVALGGTTASAQAQEQESSAQTGIGIGAEAMLTGLVGGAFVYDAGAWHVDVLANVVDTGDAVLSAAGRFFFVLHNGGRADFSVGGGLGIRDAAETEFHIEGGAQIRVFLVSNVALSTTVGLGMVLDDGEDPFALGGQLTGTAGLTYFFY